VCIRCSHIDRLLVIGTPGMGKSRSINYFLRVVIHEHRKLPPDDNRPMPVIVFAHRKDEIVWLFAPENPHSRQSPYSAFSISMHKFAASDCTALQSQDNYYIIDTGSAENARTPMLCEASTIYVCSPDRRHYSEYKKHCTGTFYFPCWRDEYIPAATPYMIPIYSKLTPEEAAARAQVVGAIPRRVYGSQINYEDFKENVESFVTRDAQDVYDVLTTGTYVVDRGSQDQRHPRSTVFLYEAFLEASFLRASVKLVSYYARIRLTMNCFRLVYSSIRGNTSKDRQSEFGKLFEVATTHMIWKVGLEADLVSFKCDINAKLERDHTKRKMTIAQRLSEGQKDVMMDNSAQMYSRMKALDLVRDACARSKHTLSFIGKNFPLIDAADARNRGFNFTLQHSRRVINLDTVAKFRTNLGLESSEVFHLIYIVDEGKADTFEVSLTNATTNNKYLLDELRVHVMALPDGFVQNNEDRFMDEN
jgi:hypothetical protein